MYAHSYPSVSNVSSHVLYVHAKNALWCYCTEIKSNVCGHDYKYLGTLLFFFLFFFFTTG